MMVRRLSAEEEAVWRKVVETVRPIGDTRLPHVVGEMRSDRARPIGAESGSRKPVPQSLQRPAGPGETLDSSWDRRLSRGLAQPDLILDLHGHDLATAYDLLDRKLEQGVTNGARLLLLITGKPPSDRHARRGAIRAAIGDWLAMSRHRADIAAVRNAHPRHGGAGALYIVLRRKRPMPMR